MPHGQTAQGQLGRAPGISACESVFVAGGDVVNVGERLDGRRVEAADGVMMLLLRLGMREEGARCMMAAVLQSLSGRLSQRQMWFG